MQDRGMGATGGQERQPYHRENLRGTLIDAARGLAAEQGLEGVTLRAVARRAGVSHTAAYHHFDDKSALVDAVAARCFADFTAALAGARDGCDGSALDRLMEVGRAYIGFAVDRPNDFDLMTQHTPAGHAPSDELVTASLAGAAVLWDLLRTAQEEGEYPPGPLQPLVVTHWATVHGLAMLIRDRQAGRLFGMPIGDATPDALTDLLLEQLRALSSGAARPVPPATG